MSKEQRLTFNLIESSCRKGKIDKVYSAPS